MRLPVPRSLSAVLAAVVVLSAAGPSHAQTAYVASYFDNAVYRYSFDSQAGTYVKDSAFSIAAVAPSALTFGPDGNLYIASNYTTDTVTNQQVAGSNQVLKYDVAANATTTYLSNATLNAIAMTNSGGAETAYGPTGIQFGSGGELFVLRSGTPSDFSGTAGVDRLSTANITGGNYTGAATVVATGLVVPGGLAYDSAHDALFVSNTLGSLAGATDGIDKVTSASTVAGSGNQSQFVAGAGLNTPTGLLVSGNQVYVANSDFFTPGNLNASVQRYTGATGATGTLDNTFSTGTALRNEFPQGLAQLNGTLYVASQGNTPTPHTAGTGNGAVYTFDAGTGNPFGANGQFPFPGNIYASAIAFQPVPEPTSILAVCGLVGGAVHVVRRRRKAAAVTV